MWSCEQFPRFVTEYQGEEVSTSVCISPPQETVASNEVFLQPPFLQSRPAYETLAFQPCFSSFIVLLWKHSVAFTSFLICGTLGLALIDFLFPKVASFCFFHFITFPSLFCSLLVLAFFILLCRHGYTHFYTVAVDLMVLLEGEKLKQWAVRHLHLWPHFFLILSLQSE